MKENRLFVRYAVKGKVLLQPTEGKSRTVRAELIDISFRGVGMYSHESFQLDSTVRFIITSLEFKRHIRGVGKVRYCNPLMRNGETKFRMGFEFTDVDSEVVRDIVLQLENKAAPRVDNGETTQF